LTTTLSTILTGARRVLCVALVLLCLMPMGAEAAEPDMTMSRNLKDYNRSTPALYTARMAEMAALRTACDTNASTVTTIDAGVAVEILGMDLNGLCIRTKSGHVGFVKRRKVDGARAEPLDPVNTPPYSVMKYRYIGVVGADTPITFASGEPETRAFTLKKGTRVSFISIENGMCKTVYAFSEYAQFGYFPIEALSSLQPVSTTVDNIPARDMPLASYMSFYKLDDTPENRGRMVNIQVACDYMNALTVTPGGKLDFNNQIGPYSRARGYQSAPVLINGVTQLGSGGGTCQVSSTLYNVVLQLPGLTVTMRRPHGPTGAPYLPHGLDAAVGTENLNFVFRNDYNFTIRFEAEAHDGVLFIAIYRVDI